MTIPLFETQADVVIQKQSKIITELEREKQVLTKQHDMWKQQWHELNDSLAKRDLEQQIKAYARAEYMCPDSIRRKVNELREQAKGGEL
tara:strand:- start:3511 stop:3777 length:267 start_codon:yes stop_codon:yes gene_type:complete